MSIPELVAGFLNPPTMKEASERLTELRNGDPDRFALEMIEVALNGSEAVQRETASVLLRKQLRRESDKLENIWFQISNETRDILREKAPKLVDMEPAGTALRAHVNLLIEIVAVVYDIEDNCWVETLPVAEALISTPGRTLNGLQLLTGLIETLHDQMFEKKEEIGPIL